MEDDGGSKDGGTGNIGFRPSTDATACQTPPPPGIPAWMLARNNSVHAPVSGRPSARESTSRKLPSTPFPLVRTADHYLAERQPSKMRARNVTSEPKASPPPPKPSSSVGLDALNDDQALALLLKNETVAGMLQNAFDARVEEHQQKLVRAYNQRLLELEEYTRSWRDATKELWSALSEGTLKPNSHQREALLWKGPQETGSRFDPDLPSEPQEVVEKEIDSDGRVACISVKVSGSSQSRSHFNRQEWIDSNGFGSSNFKNLGQSLRSFMKIQHGPRLLFRLKHDDGKIEYRPFTSVASTTRNISKGDEIMEMTPSNVALMGKAFCYLKDSNDRFLEKRSADSGTDVSAAELSFLYDRFSQEPTKRHVDVLSLQFGKKKLNYVLFSAKSDIPVIPKRLLIARPCYAATDGSINGVKFFDVGSDTHTTRQDNGEEILLFEDKLVFNRLALSLDFTFFSWKGNKHMTSPLLERLDIVVDFSVQNMLLFWKTFCILKDRNNYLLSRVAGPLAEVSRKACDDLYKKLVQHYRDSLPPKKKKKRLIQSVSLPLKYENNEEVYDGEAEGKKISRRLVIARPYHQGNRVIGAEFFDTASGARQDRVSTDIVLTEDTATLMDIGHLLEQVILEGMLPAIRQDHATRPPRSFEFPQQVPSPQIPPAEESEQPGKTADVAKSFTKTCMALHDIGLEQQDISAVLKTLASSPYPSLFQRTLALSDGLRELRDDTCHDNPDPRTRNQWLAIGGEPEDVRSLSPSPEQDSPIDNQPQSPVAKAEVLQFGLTDQRILEDPSVGSDDSDLIMLDGQPKSIAFPRREKHLLPVADQEFQMKKRTKLSTPEPFTGVGEQLPQSLHLAKRDSVEAFNPLPPPSAITTGELHKLREQLRRLGDRLQDSVDQIEESTIGGKIEEIEKLRMNIERFEGVLEAQREIEQRQEVSKNPLPGLHSASRHVSDHPKASSNYSHSPSLEPDGVTDTQIPLAGQGRSTPMEVIQFRKPSESPTNRA
ncbi:hypothetical protein SLS63_004212 [Diaporthe eres]|uniref:Uncharacterized protein n=1 Tax=Diaporthe eres TaxID=83184 RepID=A0ABR1PE62_DIAER